MLRIFPLVNSRDFHFTSRSGYLSFSQKTSLQEFNWKALMVLLSRFHPISSIILIPNGTTILSMMLRSNGDLTSRRITLTRVILKASSKWELPAFLLLLRPEIFLLLLSSKLMNSIRGKYTGRIFLLSIRSLQSLLPLNFSRATDSFVVKNPSSGENTVIAGYHWYSDWGRDTMISLPGLLLIPHRFRRGKVYS